jgi:D-alanyl-D-alanine endopeptidase (penicillin-binding protein 7)
MIPTPLPAHFPVYAIQDSAFGLLRATGTTPAKFELRIAERKEYFPAAMGRVDSAPIFAVRRPLDAVPYRVEARKIMKARLTLIALLVTALALPATQAQAEHKEAAKAKSVKPDKTVKAAKSVKAPKSVKAAKSAKLVKHTKARKPVHRSAAAKAKAAKSAKVDKADTLSYGDVSAGKLKLQSSSVVVQDQTSGTVLFEKNPNVVLPIASISKLMTAMVTLDAHPDLKEELGVSEADVDTLKRSSSHIPVGTKLSRELMLRLALMSSENRAAHSLARNFAGGMDAFVLAMNAKAKELGLNDTRFFDPTGLNAGNVSSARDLAKLVGAASKYPLIREFTTTAEFEVPLGRHLRTFHNTNALVRNGGSWEIGVSKTGYINESGKCLVMQAWFNNKPTIIVLLDSWGKLTRIGDANRIKKWVEANGGQVQG